jgi:hypothetical protein
MIRNMEVTKYINLFSGRNSFNLCIMYRNKEMKIICLVILMMKKINQSGKIKINN